MIWLAVGIVVACALLIVASCLAGMRHHEDREDEKGKRS
jgi:hypothetical protein